MKQLLIGVTVAVFGGLPALASAEEVVFAADFLMDLHIRTTASRDFRSSSNPLEAREASRFATAAGVECKVVDAGLVTRKAVLAYEVACEHDLGWIVIKRADETYAAYDCLALEASAKAITSGREIATCRLRANVGRQKAGLQSLVTKARLFCTVVSGEFKGFGGTPQISRYEISCANGTGYLIDAPSPGSEAEIAAASCDIADSLGSACTLKR